MSEQKALARAIIRVSGWNVFVLLLLAGCGREADRAVAVRGAVRIGGTSVRGGTIVFTPNTERGNAGDVALAPLQPDGTFMLTTEKGALPGPGWYRISLVAANFPVSDKLRDPTQSGLEREIVAGRENVIELNLP